MCESVQYLCGKTWSLRPFVPSEQQCFSKVRTTGSNRWSHCYSQSVHLMVFVLLCRTSVWTVMFDRLLTPSKLWPVFYSHNWHEMSADRMFLSLELLKKIKRGNFVNSVKFLIDCWPVLLCFWNVPNPQKYWLKGLLCHVSFCLQYSKLRCSVSLMLFP